ASSNGPSWEPFALAGVLIGLLPIVHVQTLIALAILLFVLLWRRRRREWFALLAVAVLLGGMRIAQLALSQHGASVTPYGSNVYPWLEPGWLVNAGTSADPSGRLSLSIGNLISGAIQTVGMAGTTQWWGFWLANLGIAVPLLGFVAIATAIRLAGGRAARAVTRAFPVPLLELTLGALASHWWRRVWPRIAAVVLVAPVLLTGALVVVRLLPWTPPQDAVTGPYTIADPQELPLAATIG